MLEQILVCGAGREVIDQPETTARARMTLDEAVAARHFALGRSKTKPKGDPVADLGYFGNDPNWLQQIVILSTGPSHVGIEVSGHANYLQEGSTSQHNIAAVVAGLPDLVVGGMVPGFGDRVRQVIEFFDRD